METILECGKYVIEITEAMLQHNGLLPDQNSHVETIHRRAVEFMTDFLYGQQMTVKKFASYLNHDALSPITVVIGYTEMFLMNGFGDMPDGYAEAFEQVRDCGYIIQDEIREMYLAIKELV